MTQSDQVFRALSDPTRREILSLLRTGRQSVGELAANFDVSRPAISKHIRVLREARLIINRSQGASRVCELNAAPLRAVDAWLADYKRFWNRSLIRLKAHMEK
jgi:DNA-binding transcriptional ArsR family regulator